jgi:hypothetical protein
MNIVNNLEIFDVFVIKTNIKFTEVLYESVKNSLNISKKQSFLSDNKGDKVLLFFSITIPSNASSTETKRSL